MNKTRNFIFPMSTCVIQDSLPANTPPAGEREWWQRPGLGISYTVESRPGWTWNRNYRKYNNSLTDENGNFKFDGPHCRIEQFVQLSREVGADYHMMYAKWHDGICFFNTRLTHWKTPKDYMAGFSRLSKKENIPFIIYYSNIFDQNPQFKNIQPHTWTTFSYIRDPEYLEYLKGQYREMVQQYEPDGMWLDWYTDRPRRNTTIKISADFFRENFPEIVVGANMSSKFASAKDVLDYTTDEIHTLGKPELSIEGIVKSKALAKFAALFFYLMFKGDKGWDKANYYRRAFDHPWEAISPVGTFWQDPKLRPDKYSLPRIAATAMACGGRNTMQVNINMDGHVLDDHVRQMGVVGEWYKPRKKLFMNTVPLRYNGNSAPGIRDLPEGYNTIASKLGDDVLIHIIKLEGNGVLSSVRIRESSWPDIKEIYLEPVHQRMEINRQKGMIVVNLAPDQVDPVDTILCLKF